MNYAIPKDPNMLYSYINMMLRDRYSSLEEFCTVNDADIDEIKRYTERCGLYLQPGTESVQMKRRRTMRWKHWKY